MTSHPWWCDGGHSCALGEHRATVHTWMTRDVRQVVSRVRRGGTDWLELRMSIRLPADPVAAVRTARTVVYAMYTLAVRQAARAARRT